MDIPENLMETILERALVMIIGLVVLFIGLLIIKYLVNGLERSIQKSKVDISLHGFIRSLVKFALYVILVITVLSSYFGIEMTTFAAIIGAAGLAIGFALRDSLGNVAGGIIILTTRPFNVGDFIQAQGEMGTVKEIQILQTRLTTPDNKWVVIPNGSLANGNITNFSAEELRRVDFTFGVSYEDDIREVKGILEKIIKGHPLTLKEPEPLIRVIEHGDSSVNFTVRAWSKKEDYWSIFYDIQEEVKIQFDDAGISIPYPQMDVHMNRIDAPKE